MLKLTSTGGAEIRLEEPCPSCIGTGIITRSMGMAGRCAECKGERIVLTANGRAIIDLLTKYRLA